MSQIYKHLKLPFLLIFSLDQNFSKHSMKINCKHLLNTSDGFGGLQDNGSLKVLEDLISMLPYVLQCGDFQYLWQRDQWSVEKTTELVCHGQI